VDDHALELVTGGYASSEAFPQEDQPAAWAQDIKARQERISEGYPSWSRP
jgi:hypothetical protein